MKDDKWIGTDSVTSYNLDPVAIEIEYDSYQLKYDFKVDSRINPLLQDEFTSSKWLGGWRYAFMQVSLITLTFLSFLFSFYCITRLLNA